MPALSFIWKVVLFAAVAIIFFPQLMRIIRVLAGLDGKSGPGAARGNSPRNAAAQTVRCHKCGAQLPPDARFCPKCGCTQDVIDV